MTRLWHELTASRLRVVLILVVVLGVVGVSGVVAHRYLQRPAAAVSSVDRSLDAVDKGRSSSAPGTAGVDGQADTPVPQEVTETLWRFVAPNLDAVRSAVVNQFAPALTNGDAAPAATVIDVEPNSWRQDGDRGLVTGVVRVVGQPPAKRHFYLLRQGGQWRVLFTDSA
jgi:hypothetical protein